jgi:hypothetical protein
MALAFNFAEKDFKSRLSSGILFPIITFCRLNIRKEAEQRQKYRCHNYESDL